MQAHSSLRRLIDVAGAVPISLVGGVVRDALLGRPFAGDIDLVAEGDAIALAQSAARALNVRLITHGRFGTAVLELPHDLWIDIVTARRETYPAPGALPVVEAGDLDDDLRRRDFSVNALAYRLNGPAAGAIVDPVGGLDDLGDGIVRILHPESFVDDPSRIVRAARYAARLDFVLEPVTRAAAAAVAPGLDPSSARVGEELRRLAGEPTAAAGLALLAGLGVAWIDEDAAARSARFAAVDGVLAAPGAPAVPAWPIRLGLVLDSAVVPALAVDGWARGLAATAGGADTLRTELAGAVRPSLVDAVLRRAAPAAAVVAAADGADRVLAWWREGRDLALAVRGSDVIAAGVAPGPAVGRVLAALRVAVLDGEVGPGRDEQLVALARMVSA